MGNTKRIFISAAGMFFRSDQVLGDVSVNVLINKDRFSVATSLV